MRKFSILILFFFFATAGFAQYTVSTLAGDTAGFLDGTNSTALFNGPAGVAVDTNGNVFVADAFNNRIRKIFKGSVSTFAGDTVGFRDGSGTTALFNQPIGVCTDATGNVYVADTYNNAIRKISTTGIVTTIGGKGLDSAGLRNGPASMALFNLPVGVAIDKAGNIYVAENGNNVVRKISVGDTVSTFAGNDTIGYRNGLDSTAEFFGLAGIAVDDSGYVYVTELSNNAVRKICKGYVTNIGGYDTLGIDTTDVTIYPGYQNGAADTSLFNNPTGIAVDDSGNVFVCDEYNNVIREISKGKVSTFAGNAGFVISGLVNGAPDTAEFYQPIGIACDNKGNFYVGDNGNNVVRAIMLPPPLGIAPIAAKKMNMLVYPTPCNDRTLIASAPSGTAQLLDLAGRVIWSNEHFKAPYSLVTSDISPGVYFIKVSNATQSAITKIVIAH